MRVHAIGDRGISMMLDIFADIEKEHGIMTSVSPSNTRSTRRKKISSVSRNSTSSHQCSLITPSTTVVGQKHGCGHDRARYSYAWRSFLDHGVALAFGTDWPVAPLDPILGVYAQSRSPRSTAKIPVAGFRRKKSCYRKQSMPTPWARHSPSLGKGERLHHTGQTRGHDHPE